MLYTFNNFQMIRCQISLLDVKNLLLPNNVDISNLWPIYIKFNRMTIIQNELLGKSSFIQTNGMSY